MRSTLWDKIARSCTHHRCEETVDLLEEALRLQPANSSMKPIYCRNVQVLGVVTGVVRRVA